MHREASLESTTTAAVALLLCGGVLLAQESVATSPHAVARDTLRGLDGVHVVVEELRPEAVDDGLSKQAIEEGVVQRLWDAGVRVLMEDQWTIAAGAPYLYLNVHAVKSKDLYVYAVDLQLNQNVRLERLPSVVVAATTWTTGCRVGAVSADSVRVLAQVAAQSVDRFIEDYRTANSAN
ncbi:MAG: hypothetical protein OXT71_13220 [Acidobacteriota bacterium]|nr:hypothetical protein [Acidobacteriota bacterium]